MRRIDLNNPDFKHMLAQGREARYKKGEILVRPSDETNDICIITKGLVKAFVIDNNGDEYIHVIYGKDELFPIAWIVNRLSLNIYYQAVTDCEVLRITREVFLESMQTSTDVSYEILRRVIDQFSLYAARVDNLEYKYARERVAYRLLLMGRRFGRAINHTIELPPISQQDIASSINLTRESVSRELSRFDRRGYIKYAQGKITILDTVGLRRELGSDNHTLYIDDLA